MPLAPSGQTVQVSGVINFSGFHQQGYPVKFSICALVLAIVSPAVLQIFVTVIRQTLDGEASLIKDPLPVNSTVMHIKLSSPSGRRGKVELTSFFRNYSFLNYLQRGCVISPSKLPGGGGEPPPPNVQYHHHTIWG